MTKSILDRVNRKSIGLASQLVIDRVRMPFLPLLSIGTRARLGGFDRLHLGSGNRLLPGWANLDIGGSGTLLWDLRKPLPIRSRRIRLVYSEHFIEHIPRSDAATLLTHARRTMIEGAHLRISTPDLRKLASDYLAGQVVRMDHGSWYPDTPCQMINEGMRLWGHVYLYDEPELTALLQECGFTNIRRVKWGESDVADLRGLESRPDFDDLILEATA